MENNNDNDYNKRVNTNSEFVNNYGKTSYNDTSNEGRHTNNNFNNNQKLQIEILATLVCFIVFVVMFKSFILFLISMLFVILLGEKFFKVIGKIFLFIIVVIAIVFGVCLFLVAGSTFNNL